MSNVTVKMNEKLTIQEEAVLNRFIEFQEAMILKDAQKLNSIISDNYTLTHMSGKTQTKEEFIDEIMNGTLNYYKSNIINPKINIIDEHHSRFLADVELTAKVYGIQGTWTLKTDLKMKMKDNNWILYEWKT